MKSAISRRAFAKGLAGTAAALGGLGIVGCSDNAASGSAASSGTTYRIGVLQLTQHSALDAANEGFIRALDESGISYEADQQNANNEQSACTTIASTFVNDGVDLILAIATPAAQACLNATTEIPIVGTAITDFAESGLVESNDAPGGNLTGTSDMNPVADQIALLTQLVPDAAQVGLLYCTAESNSEIQIQMAEEELDGLGIGHERYSFSSTNELQTVVETMVGQVDAVYAPTDNTVAAA
ncbi:ABC transporter substrate-binding protein, partial [Enorma massiliensis]|uniref:ABC transporter substrate-binding protein n=1 Tax=Enorma massiliensis TaxID=1472761 RepID=UPI00195E0AF4